MAVTQQGHTHTYTHTHTQTTHTQLSKWSIEPLLGLATSCSAYLFQKQHNCFSKSSNQALGNKRKIMRIFALPPTAGATAEPNFYDSLQKVRLRQQLEMYSLARKYDQQQQQQGHSESVQLSME
uniref:Small integral membrane protein 19 n=1 Tax=Esox lucius TaxID=8010 RepID=A0A3P8ZCP4_ESOLU